MNLIPNTTPIPNMIIREWMPRLSDVELRVLLIVTDQTLGWVEDPETGRRKEKDWISRGQLITKTGRTGKYISGALKNLIEEHHIIEALNKDGKLLDSSTKRQKNFGKIFYRLSLHSPAPTLFDSVRISKGNTRKKQLNRTGAPSRVSKRTTQKGNTTKETHIQKEAKACKHEEEKIEKWGEVGGKLPTNEFLSRFKTYSEGIRGPTPVFSSGKDGKLIKHALTHISHFQLEMLFVWFLSKKRGMAPTIGAALSRKVVREFQKASALEYGFYGRLENQAKGLKKPNRPWPLPGKNSLHENLEFLKLSKPL